MGPVLHEMVRQGRSFSGHERNCSFLNLGNGTFADVSANSGFAFPDDGRAVAQTDWDGDGDIDFWIANRSGPQVRFLQNQLATTNHFLALKLEGKSCNRDAIGARVEVVLETPENTTLIKTLRAGEGFLSQSSKTLHLGLGASEKVAEVRVHWPGGSSESFGSPAVDQRYQLVQNTGAAELWPTGRLDVQLESGEFTPPPSSEIASVVSAALLPMPRLEYETISDGSGVISQESIERPVLVNFWASWCRGCLGELKEFAAHQQELRTAGIEIVALSVDRLDVKKTDVEKSDAAQTAPELLKTLGYSGTAGWATAETVETLQLVREQLFDYHQPLSLPTSVLIDGKGRLAVLYRGPVAVDQLLRDVARLQKSPNTDALPFAGRWHTRLQDLSPFDLAWQLVEQGHLDQAIDYVDSNRQSITNHYNAPKLLTLLGNAQLARGQAQSAIAYYRDALKLEVSYSEAQNNLAWVLATHPDKNLRDGPEALRLAQTALKQGRGDVVSMLDTLATAYAENSQFTQAIEAAQKAIELAKSKGQLALASRIEGRLQLYEANKPYRDK